MTSTSDIMLNDDAKSFVKKILQNIEQKFKFEAVNGHLACPVNEPYDKIAYYTGLTRSQVENLIQDKPGISNLKLSSRYCILQIVYSMCANNKCLTYNSVFLKAINDDELKTNDNKSILTLDLFIDEMKILGYEQKETIGTTQLISEDPEVRFERYLYINKIKKLRNNFQFQQIVYVDERLINSHRNFEKPQVSNAPLKELHEFEESIFYHAVSKNGLINGMFSNKASEIEFTTWLSEIMLTCLKHPSVIIMDNGPMHGALEDVNIITKYHTKAEMLRWLTDKNIPCNNNMSKPSLFELIKKCDRDCMEYKVDQIIRAQGHEILRLPRHLYDLSITTYLWEAILKSGIGVTSDFIELQRQLLIFINNIPLSKWEEFEKVVVIIEEDIFNMDMELQ